MQIHFDTREVVGKLEKISENLTMGLHNALAQAGEIVRKDAIMNIRNNQSIDTGRLEGSITSNVEGDHVDIGTSVSYALRYGA